ncbi:MAG: TetM/TetW/TetO/TetS family tetracycline resistance ribosomal protection protein [Firmicutes bacterium]|nr:TetM/TetW/TetO/TetS family tetracycline resistance ribosomal protection protein [Bacillota bacterium]
MRKRTIGILAHVDAGKTTLTEALLYTTGMIRKLGRVDHRDAFLDTDEQERERGITIFSKQALMRRGDVEFTLLDTPGHVDFSGEMERTLGVLDACILVISATDGVQSHTRTLWNLLKRYGIPAFIFVNKMDLPGADREALLKGLRLLDEGCVDFTAPTEVRNEEMASLDEQLMDVFLETGELSDAEIIRVIRERKVYPVYFGSALRVNGIDELLDGLAAYTGEPVYHPEFAAKIFKITYEDVRLTWMKVTGGVLRVKTILDHGEKADQLRIYSGQRYQVCDEAEAGSIVAATGLTETYAGQGLGAEENAPAPALESFLTFQVLTPEGRESIVYQKLKMMEEEDPCLRVLWNAGLREIHVHLMGQVQCEVLERSFLSRFQIPIHFGPGRIIYRETIADMVEGVGHYEPLRHYAEVHLLLQPGKPGSGLQFDSACSEDVLAGNWQNLIMTHLKEKEHLGVLTGSPITDMRITLVNGRAHEKHTEGGDFRQATYRAVRQGLMQAQSRLLEPWYSFRLEIPSGTVGRAMTDLMNMHAQFSGPEGTEPAVLTGIAPVSEIMHYPLEVAAYSKGTGVLSCTFHGYLPCHDAEKRIEEAAYDPERDLENTPDSVFCSHGAGFIVPWYEVGHYMHLEGLWKSTSSEPDEPEPLRGKASAAPAGSLEEEKELMAIFERTYGKVSDRAFESRRTRPLENMDPVTIKERPEQKEYLLVDGYNIIYAWEDLKTIAQADLEAARQKLMDRLSNYQGYRKGTCILVFDAYRVPRPQEDILQYHNIYVVYTKEAETADTYIERASFEISRRNHVRVATSDAAEQRIVLGNGALRMSAAELEQEVLQAEEQIRNDLQRQNRHLRSDAMRQAFEGREEA